jgi:hypothetical protein
VDLVHEEHVPGLQVGQHGRQVAGALQHRPLNFLLLASVTNGDYRGFA